MNKLFLQRAGITLLVTTALYYAMRAILVSICASDMAHVALFDLWVLVSALALAREWFMCR